MKMFEIRSKRGKESWNFIYIWLGIVISIFGTFLGFIDNLPGLTRLIIFSIGLIIIFVSFLLSGYFQNKLIGMKIKIEDKFNSVVKQ